MSLSSHLAELRRKHASLEAKIETELKRPFADGLRLAELKREKLRLKDEIQRIDRPETLH